MLFLVFIIHALMAIEKYDLKTGGDYMIFEFTSEGSKGKIRKVVQYVEIEDNVFNLGFGDWHEETGTVNDKVVSNNGDGEKVLNTVAYTVVEFIRMYPTALIYVTGSTRVRTRHYRMGISRNLAVIGKDFDVYGRNDEGRWVRFKENSEYDAFLIMKKNA